MSKDNIGLSMKYFVLNPHKKSIYGIASRKALEIYADVIQNTNHNLARDIRDWLKNIRLEIQEQSETRREDFYQTEAKMSTGQMASEIPTIRRSVEVESRYIK